VAGPGNFGFLASHDPAMARLGADAERFFAQDPDVAILRLRQLGEFLAAHAAAACGLYVFAGEGQLDLLRKLGDRGVVSAEVAQLFHALRRAGNQAAHGASGSHREALLALKMARELAVWFHRTFGAQPNFKPGPFTPPHDPPKSTTPKPVHNAELDALKAELDRLRTEAAAHRTAAEAALAQAEAEALQRMSAEERAQHEADDHAAALALAEEAEQAKGQLVAENAQLVAQLTNLKAKVTTAPVVDLAALVKKAQAASGKVVLDESATRQLIDQQLRSAGWEADSVSLRYTSGARPQKGKNLAIAEWPTAKGPADYMLFAGLTVIGVVEAKRESTDVSASIDQARRYSEGFEAQGDEAPPGGPWGKAKVPFLFATNGRPYLLQLKTKSGIWFRDARRAENKADALPDWYTPEGLLDTLKKDIDAAHAALKAEPTGYLSFLRDYQLQAIEAVEAAIAKGQRSCLVAMATGTGKTKTVIAMVYRLLKTKRFRRVLFLVDRSALGEQAANAFKDTRFESLQTFTDIFNIKDLQDGAPDPDAKVQIATVQSIARRLLDEQFEGRRPHVDDFDCIVVDECHRGYTLDREMSEVEMRFRDEDDYISAYRRVLDHFDAVKIGLTATPAAHTAQIFGPAVFSYKYREAVIDGYLVDHLPPVRIITKLAKDGIHWAAGAEVSVLNPVTSTLDKATLPDEVDIEIDSFNKRVITVPFNRAVCGELAKHLDIDGDAKTIVFCVDDDHADIVVQELKAAMPHADDTAIRKVTGKSDKPAELIRRFRNERLPNIAVTVDLLTTGIDVPTVANVVFLRRVRSRILYEQMLGRATRLCPSIGKERFRIFDAVDIYAALAEMTDMKPIVVNPTVTFEQLIEELRQTDDAHERKFLLDQLLAKLHAKKASLQGAGLEGFQTLTGMSPTELLKKFKRKPEQLVDVFVQAAGLAKYLDQVTAPAEGKLVSEHEDHVHEVTHGYGKHGKPKDYLDQFAAFVHANINTMPALMVVKTRPRDLTRQQLRELRLALDGAGFSEATLDAAWRDVTNQDMVASIIGHVRRAAVGDALMPYAERVDRAMKTILASRPWTAAQRGWLDAIGRQLKVEVVVDKAALDQGLFKTKGGGHARLDKIFDGHVDDVLAEIQDTLWEESA
jgi:type I restriction enzyme R subunit